MLSEATIRAVVHRGERDCRVEPIARPSNDGLLVAVEQCGICGTDLMIHNGMHPRARPGLVLGHEFVGRVLEHGESLIAGDRVVCFPLIECGACEACRTGPDHVCENLRLVGIDSPGGMAELVRVLESHLHKVPEDLDAAVAAQVEPVAVCLHAVRRANDIRGKDILIVGAGPIGATLGLVLAESGVRTTTLVETNEERARGVEALGLHVARDLSARLAEIGRGGFDVIFECAGAPPAFDLANRVVVNGGTIVVVSIHKAPTVLDLQDLCFREVSLVGARVYSREDFERAVSLTVTLAPSLKRLVSSTVPLDAVPTCLEKLSQGDSALKIMIDTGNGRNEWARTS